MTGDLRTQIEIGVDASGVSTGVEIVKRRMSDLGKAVVQSGKEASGGIDGIGKSAAPAADKVEAATRNMVGSIQRQIAVMEAGSKSGADYYRVLAGQRGIDTNALKPYLDQLDALNAKQKIVGVSAGQTAAAMRQLPAQFSDIAVSLQGGQNPLSVLLQQGSQIKDSFGGVGAASKALGGYIIGLVNPLTLAAGAGAAFALAMYEGAKESTAYARSIVLSGNAAGTTASQLQDMAASITRSNAALTQGAAAGAIATLAQSGSVGAASLEQYAAAALNFERVTGQAVSKTAEVFKELEKAPLEASVKLNGEIHHLTLGVYEHIQSLEDQGKKTEAATAAQDAYAKALSSRSMQITQNLGYIATSWNSVITAATRGWDAMLGVGRSQTGSEQLVSLKKQLAEAEGEKWKFAGGGQSGMEAYEKRTAALKSQISYIERINASLGAQATFEAASTRQVQARTEWDKEGEKYLDKRAQREKAIALVRAEGLAAGASEEAIQKRILDISNKFKDSKPAAVKAYQEDAGTKYLDQLREQEAAMFAQIVLGEKLTGIARKQAEFEQLIVDIKGKGQLTLAQKQILAQQDQIRFQLKSDLLTEKISQIGDDDAKKKAKAAQDLIGFQDRAAQLAEQIAAAQEGRREAYARTLGGFGKSDAEQQRIQEVNGLYRESMRLQDQLTKATPKSQLGSDNYLAEIASIKNSLGVSLADHASYYANLQRMQGSWSLGASSALATYADESANIAKQMQQATGNAFKGMEDQLVSFTTTGKASFSSLINSVLSDIVRLQVRQNITGPLAGALNGLLGGAGRAAFSQTALGSSGFGTGLAYGNQDMGQFFADGGYTGAGGKFKPAGVVHAGEYVINAESTKKLGLGLLGQLNGYADGGLVSTPPVAVLPNYGAIAAMRSGGGGGGGNVTINNYSSAQVETKRTPDGRGGTNLEVLIREVREGIKNDIADEIGSGSGVVTRAMEGRFGLRTAVG